MKRQVAKKTLMLEVNKEGEGCVESRVLSLVGLFF
jgi:hypothetical protein